MLRLCSFWEHDTIAYGYFRLNMTPEVPKCLKSKVMLVLGGMAYDYLI